MSIETTFKIIRILEAEPFWVAALWNTGEVRINDFSKKLNDWLLDGSAAYQIFASEDTFMSVEVSAEGNLLWPETFIQQKTDGEMVQKALEMDAQSLYRDSEFVEKS